jgi:hypothetical protein
MYIISIFNLSALFLTIYLSGSNGCCILYFKQINSLCKPNERLLYIPEMVN